jgi:hypothetical protein
VFIGASGIDLTDTQGINGIHQGATTAFPVAFNTVLGVSSTCNIGSKIGGYTLTNTTIQMNDLNVGTGGKPSYTDIMVVGV